MRLAGLAVLALVLALAPAACAHATASDPVIPDSSHYLPQVGDALVFREYINWTGGYGNYTGTTQTEVWTGYLNVTAAPASHTDTMTYAYLGQCTYNGTPFACGPEDGEFTFSASTYHYVTGTDDQGSSEEGTGEWFYTNSSAPVGSTFPVLSYDRFSVSSRDASFGLHSDGKSYVSAISAVSTGTYPDGNFTAAYDYSAYYDPTTGYIVGYNYTEQDLDDQGDGYTFSDLLHVTSASFALTVAKAPPPLYTVSVGETGLSASPSWALAFDGKVETVSATSATFKEPNGTYLYAARASGYSPNASYGWLTVSGGNAGRTVAFTANPSSSGPSPLLLAVVGIVILVVVVLVVVLIILALRKRRRNPRMSRHSAGGQVGYAPPPQGAPPPPISLTPGDQPRIQQVVVKEVVKVPCRYCGSLIDSTAEKCPFCGATRS